MPGSGTSRLLKTTFILLTSCTPVIAQDSPFTLKVDVSLVAVDVTVYDASGNPITDLAKEDFLVSEDGEPQQIQHFEATETLYSTLLLFDVSGSTESQFPF